MRGLTPHAGELPVAYVQLHPHGSDATEAELLAYLRTRVGRARRPSPRPSVSSRPCLQTAVGKLFKPALKRLETERAVAEFLEEAGIVPEAVRARDDKQRGLVVAVTLCPGTDIAHVRDLLGKFTFTCEIGCPADAG